MQIRPTLAAAVLAFAAAAAFAAPDAVGEAEYMSACASCHGEGGRGDGPLAELMTVDLPDLTRISARNDGVFPMLTVIHVIDGRSGLRGHGYPMPVWGGRMASEVGDSHGPFGAEVVVRGRILSLAYYLESIQE